MNYMWSSFGSPTWMPRENITARVGTVMGAWRVQVRKTPASSLIFECLVQPVSISSRNWQHMISPGTGHCYFRQWWRTYSRTCTWTESYILLPKTCRWSSPFWCHLLGHFRGAWKDKGQGLISGVMAYAPCSVSYAMLWIKEKNGTWHSILIQTH